MKMPQSHVLLLPIAALLTVVFLLAPDRSDAARPLRHERTTTTELHTLLAIKNEWGNPLQLASWNTTDHCSWPGVTCVARGGGLVTGISFKGLNRSGSIPPSMCNLKYLTHLDISHNKLTDRFPSIPLYTCSRLRFLDLSYNAFFGELPDDISRLSPFMKYLNLTDNNFSGVVFGDNSFGAQ
ncbi:hypothetical protein ZWY2020_054338 [Hordeum vulgare]|nr:hypothetical protein ZWY2020_054338 [Hordeum vulgare]